MPCRLPKLRRATQFVARYRWGAPPRVVPRMNCFRARQSGPQMLPVPVGMQLNAVSLPPIVPRSRQLTNDFSHPLHWFLADPPPHRRDTRAEGVAKHLNSVPAFHHLLVGGRPWRARKIPELDLQWLAEPVP